MASELITPDSSSLVPGTEQYLLSLARVGLSASVDIPDLWRGFEQRKPILDSLLRSPHYEVRELALEGILRKLQEEEGEGMKRSPLWLDETTLSNLTNMAFHETHQQSLAKVRPHTRTQKHRRRCNYVCRVTFQCCVRLNCVCLDGGEGEYINRSPS